MAGASKGKLERDKVERLWRKGITEKKRGNRKEKRGGSKLGCYLALDYFLGLQVT